jgi:hypothetical protein
MTDFMEYIAFLPFDGVAGVVKNPILAIALNRYRREPTVSSDERLSVL